MKHTLTLAAAMVSLSATSHGGGIENTTLPMDLLLDGGDNQIQFVFGGALPDADGQYADGSSTGSGYNNALMPTLAYRRQVNDQLSAVVAYHVPQFADVTYDKPGLYEGLDVQWASRSVALLMNYDLGSGFALHGGAALTQTDIDIQLPGALLGAPAGMNYQLSTNSARDVNYIGGISFSIPDYYFTARLTYESATDHSFNISETLPGSPMTTTKGQLSLPAAIEFSLSSGINENTLAWFGARHVAWSDMKLSPSVYSDPSLAGEPLIEMNGDTISYELGMMRLLSEQLALGMFLAYEPKVKGETSPIGPDNGFHDLGVLGQYTVNSQVSVGGFVSYGQSEQSNNVDFTQTAFKDPSWVEMAVMVDYKF